MYIFLIDHKLLTNNLYVSIFFQILAIILKPFFYKLILILIFLIIKHFLSKQMQITLRFGKVHAKNGEYDQKVTDYSRHEYYRVRNRQEQIDRPHDVML